MSYQRLYQRWTEDEIKILKEHYIELDSRGIQKLLPHRTIRSIRNKAYRIGATKYQKRVLHFNTNLSDIERAYLAGFIDGEGTIDLRGTKEGSVTPYIEISNTNKELILYLLRLLRVEKFYKLRRTSPRSGKRCKDVYKLAIGGIKNVSRFIDLILPFLQGKKEVARLVLEFCRLRIENFRKPLSKRELEIARIVRKLNKRGI